MWPENGRIPLENLVIIFQNGKFLNLRSKVKKPQNQTNSQNIKAKQKEKKKPKPKKPNQTTKNLYHVKNLPRFPGSNK